MSKRQTPIAQQKTAIYRPRRQVRGPQPPPPPIRVPARRRSDPREKRRRWPIVLLFLFLLLTCGASSVGAATWIYQKDRILPGVQTLGVPLGGQPIEDAALRLEANWNARRVVLQQGRQASYTVALSEMGILLDAQATARAAFRYGRALDRPGETVQVLLSGTTIQPIWYFDPTVARATLADLARQIDVAPASGGVELVGTRVQTTPGTPGQELDIEAALTYLQQNAVRVAFGDAVPLSVATVDPPETDLAPLVADLNRRLSTSITLYTFDPISGESQTAQVTPGEWAGWLVLDQTGAQSATSPGWHVDQSRVASFVQAHNATLGGSRYLEPDSTTAALLEAIQEETYRAQLRIYYRARQHLVESGETLSSIAFEVGIPYPWIQQANPSLGDGLSVGQSITIPSPDSLIPLPVVQGKRIVVSLGQQRMWVYENETLKWEWLVSTGIDPSPTAPGIFQIQSHEPNAYASNWDLWMPNFMGIYRPVPTSDFMNGFHGFPTRDGANLLWTSSLGHKVTYGCILISNENVVRLYDWAEEGVIVEVRP